MQASRSLPAPSQQQSANMNPSQLSSVMDKTHTIHDSVPCHHAIQATFLYQSMKRGKVSTTISSNSLLEARPLPPLRLCIPGHDSNQAHSLFTYNYNSAQRDFQGPHEEEQHQHVYPPGPSSSVTSYTTPLSVPQSISVAEPSSSLSYSPQPTSPLHPPASSSTLPCQSTPLIMCSHLHRPLSQVGLGV
ncbi:uncharacterized protein LACBIDRAFT_314325 [Laccaria bicolor S238N-H82]|uniref:Predicted protein n=1 Tax=Laccaria bicolor (strain S238N-H82 / ATCC MYA-4686) TaxID=486041 RepID=B0DYA8_LACBS|nr:uncharacterized protein LACBIDRAFT_314325 [Laccaria bicolor S238N-H82]EDR00404.1 predicted protein [Laccaria bicolor S238N-H82]|eukprot:XP_001888963.1 predicted protein [Laccaria bicolor S238N-H82]